MTTVGFVTQLCSEMKGKPKYSTHAFSSMGRK